MAFGVQSIKKDTNAFIDTENLLRHETVEISCSVYGPDCENIASQTLDGFQVPQNLEILTRAGMGLLSATDAMQVPDLVNEKWIDRYTFTILLRREIRRVYPVAFLTGANGTIHTVIGDKQKILDWKTQ